MKFPKPFFRKAKQAWYLQLGKRQISLGRDREQAFKRYQEILFHERGQISAPASVLTAAQVSDLFLDWCQRHNDATTYDFYRKYLQGRGCHANNTLPCPQLVVRAEQALFLRGEPNAIQVRTVDAEVTHPGPGFVPADLEVVAAYRKARARVRTTPAYSAGVATTIAMLKSPESAMAWWTRGALPHIFSCR